MNEWFKYSKIISRILFKVAKISQNWSFHRNYHVPYESIIIILNFHGDPKIL